MVTCKDVILDLLFDYLEQTLTADLAAELEEHLRICAPCRAYLETYKKTKEIAAKAARPAMPEEMTVRLREFLVRTLAEERR